MRRFPYTIEAIVFFMCAAHYSTLPIEYEFVYRVVSSENNVSSNKFLNYCEDNSTSDGARRQTAEEAAKWMIWSQASGFAATSISAFIITAQSDVIGRKRALFFPLLGSLLSTTVQALIIVFKLPLYFIIINNILRGSLGSYTAVMDVSTAFLGDTVPEPDRGRRFTALEVCGSVGGGVSLFATGYWITLNGFIPPSFFLVGCNLVSVALWLALHEEDQNNKSTETNKGGDKEKLTSSSLKYEEDPVAEEVRESTSSIWMQLEAVRRIYTTEVIESPKCVEDFDEENCTQENGERKRRVWRLWFYLVSYSFYLFCYKGIEVFQTMFLLSPPICFTPELIGAQNGLDACTSFFSSFLVLFYEGILHMDKQTILLTGVTGRLSSYVLMYFAKGATLVFIATSIGVISSVTTPYLRCGVSALVSSSEQGAVFALFSFSKGVAYVLAPIIILTLYPATLKISYSFTWLILAWILLVPLVLMTSIRLADVWQRFFGTFQKKETYMKLLEEED